MTMSREEAVAALRDVETAEARVRMGRAYRFGSPHLILWGIIWMVGYSLTGLIAPRLIGPMWLALSALGVGTGVLLGRAVARRETASTAVRTASSVRWLLAATAIWLFMLATYAVMRPALGAQYEVYPALVAGLVYALAGLWGQPRYLWIGGAVFALSLIGFFFLRPVLPFWLAAVGGGGLVLGGVWLRRP